MNRLLFLFTLTAIAEAQWHHHHHGGHRHGWHKGHRHLKNHHMKRPPPVPGLTHVWNGTFQQLLDHNNPSLGTFSQEYYWDDTYYKGPGSPIFMFAPQEANASLYAPIITDYTILGEMAKQMGGATVLMEHRYWGNSSPYTELTTENMQYLTLDQAIQDCTYFANNVRLPFAPIGSNADSVPWVLVGASYSGALTAWVEAKAPGTFWAYLASSAVVEAISNLWTYYKQVELGMPKNCSKDVSLVINHMDNVLETGSAQEVHDLKSLFGLETVEHNDDFMNALTWGPSLWQSLGFTGDDGFFEWCDYVENSVNGTNSTGVAGPEGVGLQKALHGYGTWMKTVWLPDFCKDFFGYYDGKYNTECFNSYNASSPIYTDVSVSNTADRQWEWFLCNQPFGWWQGGAPEGMPTIVSRLVNVEYWVRQCALYYPPGPQGQTYGLAKGATESQVNAYTGGWYIDNTTRLIYTNGEFDPWRDATVSSFYRPGGPLASTPQVPVNVVINGSHATDIDIANGKNNPACLALQNREMSQIEEWVKQFPKRRLFTA